VGDIFQKKIKTTFVAGLGDCSVERREPCDVRGTNWIRCKGPHEIPVRTTGRHERRQTIHLNLEFCMSPTEIIKLKTHAENTLFLVVCLRLY